MKKAQAGQHALCCMRCDCDEKILCTVCSCSIGAAPGSPERIVPDGGSIPVRRASRKRKFPRSDAALRRFRCTIGQLQPVLCPSPRLCAIARQLFHRPISSQSQEPGQLHALRSARDLLAANASRCRIPDGVGGEVTLLSANTQPCP